MEELGELLQDLLLSFHCLWLRMKLKAIFEETSGPEIGVIGLELRLVVCRVIVGGLVAINGVICNSYYGVRLVYGLKRPCFVPFKLLISLCFFLFFFGFAFFRERVGR